LTRRNGECHKTHQSYPAPPLGTGRGPKPLPLQPPKARCPKVCALHAEAPRLPCRFSGDRIRPAVEPHTPPSLIRVALPPLFPIPPPSGSLLSLLLGEASCPEPIIRGAASVGPNKGRAAGTKMSRSSSTSLPPTFALNATALDQYGPRHVSGGTASHRSETTKSTTMQSHHTGPAR